MAVCELYFPCAFEAIHFLVGELESDGGDLSSLGGGLKIAIPVNLLAYSQRKRLSRYSSSTVHPTISRITNTTPYVESAAGRPFTFIP